MITTAQVDGILMLSVGLFIFFYPLFCSVDYNIFNIIFFSTFPIMRIVISIVYIVPCSIQQIEIID